MEVIHGVNASGPTACEQCGGPMRKLVTTPSIVFKGSGWAKKDARDARPAAKSGSAAAKETSGESGSGSESSAKGESASAAKSGEQAGSSGKQDSSTTTASAD